LPLTAADFRKCTRVYPEQKPGFPGETIDLKMPAEQKRLPLSLALQLNDRYFCAYFSCQSSRKNSTR